MTWTRLGLAMVLQQYRPGGIEQRLLTAPVIRDALVRNQTANPGSSSVTQLILSDAAGALEAYHKSLSGIDQVQAGRYGHDPFSVVLNESAAWFIAKIMGPGHRVLVPDVVIRSVWPTSAGAHSGFGVVSVGVVGAANHRQPLQDAAFCDRAAFFDAVIAQQDRHMANFRWDATSGRLSLLDNGYAFAAPTPKYLRWASVFVEARHAAGRIQLTADEISILQRLQSEPPVRSWLTNLLNADQVAAFFDRVDRMLGNQQLVGPLEY